MLASWKTKYTADSVESRPGNPETVACTTYQLDTQTHKLGDVTILRYSDGALNEIACCETGGVLDTWWVDDTRLFAANASGNLQILNFTDKGLSLESTIPVSDSILLAVDGAEDVIVTSETNGRVFLLSKDQEVVSSVKLHGAQGWGSEVWGLALNPHNHSVVFTGGDDCLLKCHDFRSGNAVFVSKHHEMGVCCISPDPSSEHHMLSGSYDETVLHWDMRSMRQPLQSCKLGGGVWRIKRNQENTHILVAGMHSGFHILDLEKLQINKTFTEHGSLAYGAAWMADGLVATCSFYDNLFSVWDSGLDHSMISGT